MRVYIIVIILLVSFTSLFSNDSAEVKDALRIKIENSTAQKLYVDSEIIYSSPKLISLYQNRMFEPLWIKRVHVQQLLNVLNKANQEGLNPADYHLSILEKLYIDYDRLSAIQKANLDLLASDAFLLYTSHLVSGKINPESIDAEWYLVRREADLTKLLVESIQRNTIVNGVNSVLPKQEEYNGLKNALAKYENLKDSGEWQKIPEGETLKQGMEHDRVGMLRNRLAINHSQKKSANNLNLYDQELFNEVIKFQRQHGLLPDGEIGKETLAELNVDVQSRINQIKANLERLRWLPQEFGTYYIKVNIADYTLEVVKNSLVERQHRVIVGRNYRRTPVFSSKITYLVFNPTWTVPPGILKADILPAVRKNSNYLKSRNIGVYDGQGNLVDQSTIDWNSKSAKAYTYRQVPGPDNALGAVKFMFPNKFNVYLHDTPSKELFEKNIRSFSSGCIRVDNPLELAEYLLSDKSEWNAEKISKQIASKKSTTVTLSTQPEIYVVYFTAWVDKNGALQFRNDLYNRDEVLIKNLKETAPLK